MAESSLMLISHLRFGLVINRLKQTSLGIIVLASLVSCQTSLISIEDVSHKTVGKTVYLTGTVEHLAPLVDNSAYRLKDTTGNIWVVTTQNSPKFGQKSPHNATSPALRVGQQVKIKGKIKYQSLPFAEQELGDFYVVELEQLPLPIEE